MKKILSSIISFLKQERYTCFASIGVMVATYFFGDPLFAIIGFGASLVLGSKIT